jgi:hypothetical protein
MLMTITMETTLTLTEVFAHGWRVTSMHRSKRVAVAIAPTCPAHLVGRSVGHAA